MVDEDPGPRARGNTFWREFPVLLGIAILIAILVRAFAVQTFYIPSGSMEHTLNINDRVLVNKLVYDLRDPHRGEVIVFTSPARWRTRPDEKDFIKRVIGVGGDHVVCCDAQGRIMVNDVALDEPYVNQDTGQGTPSSPDPFDVIVPNGRLWVMGDNRYFSGDSREQYLRTNHDLIASTIPLSAVIGRAFVLFWPWHRAAWLPVPSTFHRVPRASAG